MRYLPHTSEDISQMLAAIGVDTIDALFEGVPASLRMQQPLDLPPATSEPELLRDLHTLAGRNAHTMSWRSFLGAGSYHHFIPALIWQLMRRGEFLTPYTPYQPEIGQGTLQIIFEYQSMMCEMFGLEVANASTYDISAAVIEAILMAERITRRHDHCVIANVNPQYRAVAQTTVCADGESHTITVPYSAEGGVDMEAFTKALTPTCAACVVQYPSMFGTVEDLRPIADAVHQAGALLIVAVPDPIAMGLLEAPGHMGADIVVSEGQSLGIPTNNGGPYVGRPLGRRHHRRRRASQLCAHIGHARTIHSSGKSHVEHLYESTALRGRSNDLYGLAWQSRAAKTCAPQLGKGRVRQVPTHGTAGRCVGICLANVS
jgi:glycine dehydrogenase subunit 1